MKAFLRLSILCLAGCGILYPDIRLKRFVDNSELIGIWQLTEDSFADIKTDSDGKNIRGNSGDYWIDIREDGTFLYHSFLQMPTRLVNQNGTWELKPHPKKGNTNYLFLTFKDDDRHHSLDFTEQRGELLLWEYFGDPDSWRLAKYKK